MFYLAKKGFLEHGAAAPARVITKIVLWPQRRAYFRIASFHVKCLSLENYWFSSQKKVFGAGLCIPAYANSQNRAMASAPCIFMHSSNKHHLHAKYRIFIFPSKNYGFWSMRLRFLNSRRSPGGGKTRVGVARIPKIVLWPQRRAYFRIASFSC